MDVIAMHQAGFNMAVASLGTAFTSGQATLLRRFVRKVYLAYDSDQAGIDAALKAIAVFRDMDMNCRIINMEPHKDPDEFIKTLGKEEFQKRIDEAENSFFFEIRILEGQYNLNDPEEKTKFHRSIAEKLCEFEEEVERENYIQAVATVAKVALRYNTETKQKIDCFISEHDIDNMTLGVHVRGTDFKKNMRDILFLLKHLSILNTLTLH